MNTFFPASVKIGGIKYNAFDLEHSQVKVEITESGTNYNYRRMSIENVSGTNTPQITEPYVIDIELPCKDEFKLHSVTGSHSNWESFLCIDEDIKVGDTYSMIPLCGRSSDQNVSPFIDITVDGKVYLFAIGWTGQWRFVVTRKADTAHITCGINNADFYLKPAEKFNLSSVLILEGEKDEDAAAIRRRFRRLMLTEFNPLPECMSEMPFSQSESDASYDTLHYSSYEGLAPVVERAFEKVGKFDQLWLDACWFAGGFPNGVGNYTFTSGFAKDGLKPLTNRIHELGGKIMLWFEPMRARTGTQIYREHPEWLLHVDDATEEEVLDYDPHNYVYNIGDEDAFVFMRDLLINFIREQGIDNYREDFNIAPLEYWLRNDENGRIGVTEIKFINNFYRLWDVIRAEFPNLFIDNCASGGRRIDFETARRSVTLHRCDGACGPWVPTKHTDVWNQNQNLALSEYLATQSSSGWSLKSYEVRSALTWGMAFVMSLNDPNYDCDTAKEIFDEIKHFKSYWDGDFYPLTRQSIDEDCFIAYQLAKGDKGYVSVFRRVDCPDSEFTVGFKAICKEATYDLKLIDEYRRVTELKVKGEELINGLTVTLPEARTSLLVEYFKA